MSKTTAAASVSAEAQDAFRQIAHWFKTALPEPNTRNIYTQLGVHFEEVSEMLSALRDAADNDPSAEALDFFHSVFEFAQRRFKEGPDAIGVSLDHLDREALLDSLCDQIVTAIGTAHVLGMDIIGALKEVADSNDSKFDDNGDPIFNEHRKIMKGPNYFSPNLLKFT